MPFRLLMGSAAGLTVAFLLLPILALVPMSLSRTTWLAFPPDALTLEWYGRVLADREWREAAWTSLVVAALAALLAGLLGTPAGLALGRGRGTPRLRRAFRGLVLLPVMVPVVLVAIALYATFAAAGLGGTLIALILAHTALGVPYVVLSVEAPARGLDSRLEEVADPGPIVRSRVRLDGGERLTVTRPPCAGARPPPRRPGRAALAARGGSPPRAGALSPCSTRVPPPLAPACRPLRRAFALLRGSCHAVSTLASPGVQWIADAWQLVRRAPSLDWDRLLAQAADPARALTLGGVLRCLVRDLGADVPDAILRGLERPPAPSCRVTVRGGPLRFRVIRGIVARARSLRRRVAG